MQNYREAVDQIQLRAADIPDPRWKSSYLTRNPHVVRVQRLVGEWGVKVEGG